MDALELKLSLIEQLKTIDDVKLLTTDQKFDQHSNRKERKRANPAQMTLDELKEVLKKSREESKKGLGMTTEELRKRYPLCE